jgi:hypothetical protein
LFASENFDYEKVFVLCSFQYDSLLSFCFCREMFRIAGVWVAGGRARFALLAFIIKTESDDVKRRLIVMEGGEKSVKATSAAATAVVSRATFPRQVACTIYAIHPRASRDSALSLATMGENLPPRSADPTTRAECKVISFGGKLSKNFSFATKTFPFSLRRRFFFSARLSRSFPIHGKFFGSLALIKRRAKSKPERERERRGRRKNFFPSQIVLEALKL